MVKKNKKQNTNNPKLEKAEDEITQIYFKKDLNTDEKKYKYLEILDKRIDENKKSIRGLLMIMFFIVFAFPLILSAEIRDINIGPFTLNDGNFVLLTIPSIFAFCYYRLVHLHMFLSEQTKYYEELLAIIFNHNVNSFVNMFLRPYFFLKNSAIEHYQEKSKTILLALNPIKVITTLFILFSPYYFVFYSLKENYTRFKFENTHEKIFFSLPIFFMLLSILLKIQVIKRIE